MNLLVVDVHCNPLAKHQLHGGGVAELHRGFNDQVDALIWWGDPVQVNRIMDGGIPGANRQHLVDETSIVIKTFFFNASFYYYNNQKMLVFSKPLRR